MLFPRLITFAVFAFCASIAGLLFFRDVIPIQGLQWAIFAAMTLFALSAFIMFTSMWDGIKKDDGGVVAFNKTNPLGRLMSFVTQWRPSYKELHCCDVYIDTTKATLIGVIVVFMMIAGIDALIFKTLSVLIVLALLALGILAIFSTAFIVKKVSETRFGSRAKQLMFHVSNAQATELFSQWVGWTFIAAIVIIVVGVFSWFGVYAPIAAFIAAGYTLLGAIGLWFFCVSAITFPAYCIAGKKLVQKTGKFGEMVCPVFRR